MVGELPVEDLSYATLVAGNVQSDPLQGEQMGAPETQRASAWDYTLDRTSIEVTETMVARLLVEQFPALAAMPVRSLRPWGTDNAMFRLGDELVVRLPRSGWAKDAVAKEMRWLPALAARLPVAVPEVIGCGTPSEEYPWTWAVYRWIAGEKPPTEALRDARGWAGQLAEFLAALAEVTETGGPEPGPHNGFRGGPPAARDRWVRPAILDGPHPFDRDTLMAFWEHALELPVPGTTRWLHGDLTPMNVLVHGGRVSAVIDWGCLAVGDRACDLMIAWNFDPPSRDRLRAELTVDGETWARGRAAAFWQWIGGATADKDNEARRVVDRVVADYLKDG